jgi:hypothetical protein
MVKVITFGCRINSYESEVFKEKLKDYDNLIVVNTCAVTAEAERQCRQAIRKLRKENPEAKIIVTGCAAQVSAARFNEMEEVDLGRSFPIIFADRDLIINGQDYFNWFFVESVLEKIKKTGWDLPPYKGFDAMFYK